MSFAVCVTRLVTRQAKFKPFLSAISDSYLSNCRGLASKPVIKEYLKPEFSISKEEAERIVKEKQSKAKLTALLKNYGLKPSILKKHPWILSQSINVLEKKLDIIKDVSLNSKNIDILKLELEEVQNINEKWENEQDRVTTFEQRVTYFQKELNLPYKEAVDLVKRYKFLRTRSLHKISEIMELLKSAGFDNEAIHEDMWIFCHNVSLMKARLTKIKEYKCPIKTWMLRCSEKILTNSLRRWTSRIEVLGESQDLIDYLANRLKCDRQTVTFLTTRNVRLLTINPPKIKKVLDYLFQHGFTPSQFRQTPRVFNCSIKTIQKRMMEFKKLGYNPHSLAVFYNSKENHNRLIRKIQGHEE